MPSYTSYWLYQKYEKRGDQDWIPVYPNEYSINGDGTFPLIIKSQQDVACGYSPDPTLYRWVNLNPSVEYICDECPQYRWTPSGYTCVGYDKWAQSVKEVSYDGGTTWTPVTPPVTSATTLIEVNSEYCGYTPPGFDGRLKLEYSNGDVYTTDCGMSPYPLTQSDVKPQGYDWLIMTSCTIGNCVEGVSASTFLYLTGMTECTIGSGVTYIGNDAFYQCWKLSNIDIPDNVTSIGESVFGGCTGLTSVSIGSGVTSIGNDAFLHCYGLTSITIPNNVTSIGNELFDRCTGLTSVSIGSGISRIGWGTFADCISLSSITIPSNVTTIGSEAFYNCSGLTYITVEAVTPPTLYSDAFTRTNNCPIYVPCESLEVYKQANRWSDYASRIQCMPFRGKFKAEYSGGTSYSAECDSITTLTTNTTKPEGYEYSAMTDAEIGICVTSIGYEAFSNCYSLSSITIPNSVTNIDGAVFYNCYSLSSITIPDSVTSIYDGAFMDCTNLTGITIPSGVTSINMNLFKSCSSLTGITIPNSITSIGDGAFAYCNSLLNINISSGVTSIGERVLEDCISLSSITISNNNTIYDSRNNCNAIIKTSSNTLITGCKNTVIPNTVTRISGSAFYQCTSLSSITIPNSVTSVGNSAFYQCRSLSSIIIPNSVTNIANNGFRSCVSATTCTIGSGVTSIGSSAFAGCISLTAITISADTPPTLGSNAFDYTNNCPIYVPCESLEDYKQASGWSDYASRIQYIPGSCTPQYRWAPSGYTCVGYDKWEQSVKEVSYDSGTTWSAVTPTETSATSLVEVNSEYCGYVPPDFIKWKATYTGGSISSASCDSTSAITSGEITLTDLVEVEIGICVTNIGDEAFANCYSLLNIDIPDNVTSIGNTAFILCYSISSCTIGNGVTSIGSQAFQNCSELRNITIPSSVTTIGNYTFRYCGSLQSITVEALVPPTLGINVFYSTNNCPIYVPSSSVQTYKQASGWSDYASRIQAIQ